MKVLMRYQLVYNKNMLRNKMHRFCFILQRQLVTAACSRSPSYVNKNQVAKALLNNSQRSFSKDANPDIVDYNKRIDTLVKSKKKGASTEAQLLLTEGPARLSAAGADRWSLY